MSASPPLFFFFVVHNSDCETLSLTALKWAELHQHLFIFTVWTGVPSSSVKTFLVLVLKWFPYSCVIISCSLHFFLFFLPSHCMKFGAEAFFHRPKKKKNQIRGCTGRKRPEQEWISETNCPAEADRRVGLLFQMIPCFITWATETLRSFWKGLQHLWIVCLVRKERTIFCLFSLSCCLIHEQSSFQMLFWFLANRLVQTVWCVEEAVLLSPSAACARLGRQRALQPLHRCASCSGCSLTDACLLTLQPQFGDTKKSQKWGEGMSLRRWLLGGMLWTRIRSYVSLHNGVKNKIMTKWCILLHEQSIPVV